GEEHRRVWWPAPRARGRELVRWLRTLCRNASCAGGGMGLETAGGDRVFRSTLPVARGERRLALTVVLVSTAIFLAVVPFARFPFAPVLAFIPMYQSALAINDLMTAVLLFGQFTFLRS